MDINADSREKYFSIPNSSPIPSQQRRLVEQSCLERGSLFFGDTCTRDCLSLSLMGCGPYDLISDLRAVMQWHWDTFTFREQLAIADPAFGHALWNPDPGELLHWRWVMSHRLCKGLLSASHPSRESPTRVQSTTNLNHFNSA